MKAIEFAAPGVHPGRILLPRTERAGTRPAGHPEPRLDNIIRRTVEIARTVE